MGVKYKMSFTNAQEIECSVNFIVDDDIYNDEPIILYGGPRPFVLSEFNQESDFYKPIRPQQATIEILASAGAARLEAFITEDDDRQIKVRFDLGSFTGYWYGVVSQEDMQETWIAQNHIITLRADEGFGVLKTIPLQSDTGEILSGNFTPFTLIQYAATETVRTFLNTYIYSNLFHTSMNSGTKQTGIDQCLIDAKSFETSPNVFEDSYTVLEKINAAFNQTIFQYLGDWWIVRMEELYIPSSSNLTGFVTNQPVVGQRANANTRYTISVSGTGKVKPIMPEAIKSLNKPSKITSINYDWDRYSMLVCNQTFENGKEFIFYYVNGTGELSNLIDDWVWEYQSFLNPTVIDTTNITNELALPYHTRVFTNYRLDDEYINIPVTVPSPTGIIASGVDTWLRSCNIYVTQYDNIDIDFQYRFTQKAGGNISTVMCVILLYATDGTKYSLNSLTRTWVQVIGNLDGSVQIMRAQEGQSTSVPDEWSTFSCKYDDERNLLIQPMPKSGYINILLFAGSSNVLSNGSIRIKDLNVDITPYAQRNRQRVIAGNTDQYTIAASLKKNTEKEIYLSDSYHVYRGAIYQTDGFTLTSGGWFRRRYSTENRTFKQSNAIANWFENRRYKIRLEANFFGILYDYFGSDRPIGLMNTINFVNDLPTKTFAIVNMREIDFMNCTWTAELLEIWDDNLDDTVLPGNSDVYTNEFYYE